MSSAKAPVVCLPDPPPPTADVWERIRYDVEIRRMGWRAIAKTYRKDNPEVTPESIKARAAAERWLQTTAARRTSIAAASAGVSVEVVPTDVPMGTQSKDDDLVLADVAEDVKIARAQCRMMLTAVGQALRDMEKVRASARQQEHADEAAAVGARLAGAKTTLNMVNVAAQALSRVVVTEAHIRTTYCRARGLESPNAGINLKIGAQAEAGDADSQIDDDDPETLARDLACLQPEVLQRALASSTTVKATGGSDESGRDDR